MSKGLGGKFISLGKPKTSAGGQILILPTVMCNITTRLNLSMAYLLHDSFCP